MFVDGYHPGDEISCGSRNGFLIHVNSTLVQIETSIFGAEFVATKQSIDALRGLRQKLRMMGIPVSSSSYIMMTICQ